MKKHKFIFTILVILLSIFAVRQIFIPGFFPMHDDTQVARVFELAKSLKAGMFPVRWVADLGYGFGYPLFNFYGPFAYYIGGLFVVVGFDALMATKLMMAIGILLSGVGMYFLAREFFGDIGGVVAGVFYVYAPYHAVDIFVRGDVAEFYAYALLPFIFFGLQKIYKENQKSKIKNKNWVWVIFTAIAYALLIASHNLSALMVTPFIILAVTIYSYISYKNKQLSVIRHMLYAILLGLGLSAFYFLPALLEMKYTNVLGQIGGGADYKDHFVCFSQLWDSPWGFGGSVPGCIDGLSFKIGKLHVLSILFVGIATIFMIVKTKKLDQKPIVMLLSIAGFILSCFLMLEVSKPLWDSIKTMAFFQYPWRFLLLASFFSSLCAGGIINSITDLIENKKIKEKLWFLSVVLIAAVLFLNIKLFTPQTILSKTANDYTNDYSLKWIASKISDEYLPKGFMKPKSYQEVFQGVRAVTYTQTQIEKIANVVSIASILIILLGIIPLGRKRYEKNG